MDRGNKKPLDKDHRERTKTMVLLVIKKGGAVDKRRGLAVRGEKTEGERERKEKGAGVFLL